MENISFDNGLSGISRVAKQQKHDAFPKSKTALKPSGGNVVEHFWKALELGKTFEHQERDFAIKIPGILLALTPDEHFVMTGRALSFMKSCGVIAPEIKKAAQVLQESKSLQEELLILRNTLLPA